jgi:HSP20 family protein
MALPVLRSPNTVNRWDPFREFEDLHNQMDKWLESVFTGVTAWSPSADVSETADAYVVEIDLPGVKREDVTVELMGTMLAITGELKEQERAGSGTAPAGEAVSSTAPRCRRRPTPARSRRTSSTAC